MYGAFCYQQDGEGYITPFFMGLYDSVEAFNKDLPRLKETYGIQYISEDNYYEFPQKRIIKVDYISYPNVTRIITVGYNETLFSLEKLTLNDIHLYRHPNDVNEEE